MIVVCTFESVMIVTYLLLYVDNMLIAVKDKIEVRIVKAQLIKEFEMILIRRDHL